MIRSEQWRARVGLSAHSGRQVGARVGLSANSGRQVGGGLLARASTDIDTDDESPDTVSMGEAGNTAMETDSGTATPPSA